STPIIASLSTMRGTAAAASGVLTVTRTISDPARQSSATCFVVAATSAVSVLVMDCTTTGAPPPTSTFPIRTRRVARRGAGPKASVNACSSMGPIVVALSCPDGDRIHRRDPQPQPAQHPGPGIAGGRLPAGLGGRRAEQRRPPLLRAPVFLPQGRPRAGALRDVPAEEHLAEVRPARGPAGAGARPADPVRGARRVPAGARPHGGGRRRRTAARVRGAEGAAAGRGPVRRGAQAPLARLRAPAGGADLAHRRRG